MIDRIHGGNCPEGGIVDFSVNINPLGLPGGLRGIISKNIDRILQYPDPLSTRLKMRLAELHGVSEENIALGNGSIELIHLIPRAFGIKRALMITPSFSEYEFALKLNGSKSIFLNTCEKEDFRIDLDRIAGSLPSSGAFFLCNPNNPTGTLLHQDEVSYIVRLCRRRRTTLVLDEAFIEFTEEAARKAVITNAVKNGSVIALRSLTKFFAMPGL
jgi:threonine-phosphate decarboxylase